MKLFEGRRMHIFFQVTLFFYAAQSALLSAPIEEKATRPANVKVIISIPGGQPPKIPIPRLVIHPDGSLQDNRKVFNDRELSKLLNRAQQTDSTTAAFLEIICSQEGRVSMQTLGKTLNRICKLAEKNQQVIVYVTLREITLQED